MPEDLQTLGVGEIAEDKKRLRADARMLRRLVRCPLYIPNEVFTQAARKMWGIVQDDMADPRARVAAQKTINEMMKVNLAAVESAKDKQNVEQHLHLHGQVVPHSKIFYDLPAVKVVEQVANGTG